MYQYRQSGSGYDLMDVESGRILRRSKSVAIAFTAADDDLAQTILHIEEISHESLAPEAG